MQDDKTSEVIYFVSIKKKTKINVILGHSKKDLIIKI